MLFINCDNKFLCAINEHQNETGLQIQTKENTSEFRVQTGAIHGSHVAIVKKIIMRLLTRKSCSFSSMSQMAVDRKFPFPITITKEHYPQTRVQEHPEVGHN
jgi:hypothetical protein